MFHKILLLTIIVALAISSAATSATAAALSSSSQQTPSLSSGSINCNASDATLRNAYEIYCASMTSSSSSPWCTYPSAWNKHKCHWPESNIHCDWINQVFYFIRIMKLLANESSTCIDTPYAQRLVGWIENYQSNVSLGGSLISMWQVAQINAYYTYPRKPGERLEQPSVLGYKSFAFAWLAYEVPLLKQVLRRLLKVYGTPQLLKFTTAYTNLIPESTTATNHAIANCFLNTTYQPQKHNGTCAFSVLKFKAGYEFKLVEVCKLNGFKQCPPYPYWS